MTALPFLSVIMPIRNEGAIIRESLEAVLAQDYDQDRMEILVVDGMSTDDTRQIVLSMQSRSPNIILLDNPGKIVPVGMNIALRRARGDIFVRVDGHCTIARDYVSRCVGICKTTVSTAWVGRCTPWARRASPASSRWR